MGELLAVECECCGGPACTAAEAEWLNGELQMSFTNNDFDLAQGGKQALAIAAAFCRSLQHSANDPQRHLAAIDPQLDGLQTVGWG